LAEKPGEIKSFWLTAKREIVRGHVFRAGVVLLKFFLKVPKKDLTKLIKMIKLITLNKRIS